MARSFWQTVECDECGAQILSDTRAPLTRDPNEHEDDCPSADQWEEVNGSQAKMPVDLTV